VLKPTINADAVDGELLATALDAVTTKSAASRPFAWQKMQHGE